MGAMPLASYSPEWFCTPQRTLLREDGLYDMGRLHPCQAGIKSLEPVGKACVLDAA